MIKPYLKMLLISSVFIATSSYANTQEEPDIYSQCVDKIIQD